MEKFVSPLVAWVLCALAVAVLTLPAGPVLADLNYTATEIDGDGIDNDGDGYTDSEDTECGSHYEGIFNWRERLQQSFRSHDKGRPAEQRRGHNSRPIWNGRYAGNPWFPCAKQC